MSLTADYSFFINSVYMVITIDTAINLLIDKLKEKFKKIKN